MASRRMVSLKIVDSAKFIKMPLTTQNLYFHLIVRADDDGIVEAFNVIRMTGSNEDDLKILIAKGFVRVLNDDLVSFITDWHEHNLIRADRKIDSIYKNLLLQIVPEVTLIEPKERACKKHAKNMDGQWPALGPHLARIGKDRLGKDSIDKDREEQVKEPAPSKPILITIQGRSANKTRYDRLVGEYGQTVIDTYWDRIIAYEASLGKQKYKDMAATVEIWINRDRDKGSGPVKVQAAPVRAVVDIAEEWD
jgi:hypothetical protein